MYNDEMVGQNESKSDDTGPTLPYSAMGDAERDGRSPNRAQTDPVMVAGRPRGRKDTSVKTMNFAGRLGGNQQFTEQDDSASEPADAFRDARWATILDPSEFRSIGLWKAAAIEGIALCLQTYLGAMLIIGLLPTATATNLGAVTPVAFASIFQIFLISLFVYACGPITGAHLNPMITIATFLARLSSLPRTVLYVAFQCTGAVIGAMIFRESIGATPADIRVIPGCYADPAIVTPGQAFACEFMFAMITLVLAFGLGLDPRNAGAFGPGLAPILIGISSAVCIFAGSFSRAGYLGAAINPARCLGLATASHNWTYHYIHWTGDISAAVVNALMYFLIPPYTARKP